MKQGSEEWHLARAGMVTASRFSDVLTKPKGGDGLSVGASTYLYELVGQRLTGGYELGFENHATRWGHEQEPSARASYQWHYSKNVAEFGFVKHPDHPFIGGSPDGVVIDEDGIIEIKCPWTTKEHIRTLVTKAVPKQYVAQVQGNLWITGKKWCDFISYDPRLQGAGRPLCVVRVERDEPYIEVMAEMVIAFTDRVATLAKELRDGK